MKNDQWLERERSFVSPASHRPTDPKFGRVYCRGRGARLWDIEGRDFIDLTCGYSASNFGHVFEPLVNIATRQLSILTHLTQEPHVGRIELASKLIELCGFGPRQALAHFNATGARAIETAWKAAYNYRPGKIVSVSPSYHGRSLATAEVSETGRAVPGLVNKNLLERRAANEFAYCAACQLDLSFPVCQTKCIDSLLEFLRKHAESISAILVEPAVGARGYIFPPNEYWHRLRETTTAFGILLIADEIQVGLGRCGSILLSRHQGWNADLVVLGKSLGGGVAPISAVVGRREVLESLPPETESETFACTPFASAIAIEVLNQLENGGWIEHGAKRGLQLRQWCQSFADNGKHPVQVDGMGASAVLEFLAEDVWRKRDTEPNSLKHSQLNAKQFASRCADNGLLVHYTGPLATRVAMLPPLTMTDEEFQATTARLEKVAVEYARTISVRDAEGLH
jgi:4-aminobutyrate aminotransferase-like enzyme